MSEKPTQAKDVDLGADAWGIHARWTDAADELVTVPEATVTSLRSVIGEPPADLDDQAPVVTRPGRDPGLGAVTVRCEDGTERDLDGPLPEDFPLGYHQVVDADAGTRSLIVSPGRCWLPDQPTWGWTVQLYAARSATSWGMGDLGDLRTLREWAQSQGAGFLLVNPLHAVGPGTPQEASPYLPATRRFRNPLYLRLHDVPGVEQIDLTPYDERGASLNDQPFVDRDAVWTLKHAALRAVFDAAPPGEDFDFWRREQGEALEGFARWSAISEQHGTDWHDWPEPLRKSESADVASYASDHADRVRLHAWLQWLLEQQFTAASGDLTVIQDFPIGVSGGGADAWAWQDVLAEGVRVGAPPDLFNRAGQDWGSPPLVPWRVRAGGYDAFVSSIRGTIAGGGGLRVDHVMGLFRLWWVPEGEGPANGAYVRYPSEDLLDIVALESHRARALVVGEDLGTVEDGVRESLADHGVLSYRLLWFEDDEPEEWPTSAMAAITTHDLPTVAGLWSGSDVQDQAEYVVTPEAELERGRAELLGRMDPDSSLGPESTATDAVLLAHRALGRAPSLLLSATLEDAVAEERRPNLPGVVDRPNWQLPLAVRIEELADLELPARIARLLSRK